MFQRYWMATTYISLSLLMSACNDSNATQLLSNNTQAVPKKIQSEHNLLPKVPTINRTQTSPFGLINEEAPVPPMCYTKTEGKNNPCYVCHQVYKNSAVDYRSNKLNDGSLQGGYQFSDIGIKNQWSNLFVDRNSWIEQISDSQILTYINQENYQGLAKRLQDSNWSGFIPDLKNFHLGKEAFHDNGIAKDGSGWVAFNYKPLPSTFWPTNGSTDDVLIRLASDFRTIKGTYNQKIYQLNLALVELNLKQLSQISIPASNEKELNIDLNGDNKLTDAVTQIITRKNYLGDAKDILITPQQYPKDTEFMHSVRYVGVDDNQQIVVPPRMKELRYMKKIKTLTGSDLEARYSRERKEKLLEELPTYVNHHDKGFSNGMGWLLQGFIEDYNGELRPQILEEQMFCMGCHAAIGTTIDQTFSFARKVEGEKGWGYINLKGMKDTPSISQNEGEILQYLKMSGGGNEFRENDEMLARWFNSKGEVNENAVKQSDVYQLITPSPQRALKLNKAYTHIVRHQSYIKGRDATWKPVTNVLQHVDESVAPLSMEHRLLGWETRLKNE